MIGDNIKKYREAAGLTQIGFAKILGYSRQTIHVWENNTVIPSIPDVCIICSIFDVEPNELIGDITDYARQDKSTKNKRTNSTGKDVGSD